MGKVTSLAWCKTCDTAHDLNYLVNQDGNWKIACLKCGLTLTHWHTTKDGARKAWNKFLYNMENKEVKPVLECVRRAAKNVDQILVSSITETIHQEYTNFIIEVFKDGDFNILYDGNEEKIKNETSLQIKVLYEVIEIEGETVNFNSNYQATLFGINAIFRIIYTRLTHNRLAMILFQETNPEDNDGSLYKKWLVVVSLPKKLGPKGVTGPRGPNDKALALESIHIGHPDPVGPRGPKGPTGINTKMRYNNTKESPFGNKLPKKEN